MGAQEFVQFVNEPKLSVAFDRGVSEAAWEHGHGGYSGTLAEKHSVVRVDKVKVYTSVDDAQARADELNRSDASPVNDKWGPAGALRVIGVHRTKEYQQNPSGHGYEVIDVEKPVDGWLLFGWASS